MEILVLGKTLGTCAGWDQLDTWALQFIDVTFNKEAVQFLRVEENRAAYFNIDFELGGMEIISKEGDELSTTVIPNWLLFRELPDYKKEEEGK